jgi:Secretion system C-terminal sorting domain
VVAKINKIMKKFTILFVTMLAMSGLAFGQKEGKVVWENLVEGKPLKTSSGKDISVNSFITPFVSSSGNSLISLSYSYYEKGSSNYENGDANVYTYDKKGQILSKVRGYYRHPNGSSYFGDYRYNYHTLYGTVQQTGTAYRDSIIFLDKDIKFQKGFDIVSGSTSLFSVQDGVFYSNPQNTLIKYDINAKEEWRYESKDAIEIITQKPPYLGLISAGNENKSIALFDKKGNKKGETSPQPIAYRTYNFNTFFVTSDNGFWLNTSPDLTKARLIRFDSTGKELANISLVSVLTTFSDVNFGFEMLPDNSLIVAFLDSNYEINIVKIDEKGNKTIIRKDLGIKGELELKAKANTEPFPVLNYFKVAKDGTIIYGISYSYIPKKNVTNQKIYFSTFGGEKFSNLNFSWFKTTTSRYYVNLNYNPFINDLLPEIGNSIQIRSAYYDDSKGLFTESSIAYYELNGKLKWSYTNTGINEIKQQGNQIYVYQESKQNSNFTNLYVLDYDTGKILWQMDNITMYYLPPYKTEHLRVDKSGNTYLQFYKTESLITKLNFQVIKRDGTVLWQYNPSNYINAFEVADDGIIATTFEYTSSELKYFIRKISPCESLSAILITGNTEACPTEKVKLSVPKQDGITYQWQKDGKDIPNSKDVVYDFGESGTYTVVAKDELCQNSVISNALKVNIRPLPSTEITAPKSTFCDGEKTTIASKTNGTFFQWQKDGKDILNATSGIYEVSQAGDYRVGVRDDKCPQVGYSNIYTIITKLLPDANITTDIKGVVYEPITVKMSANSGTGLAYQWLKDDVLIPNETKATYEAKKSGKYKVNVTYDGCTKLSDALTISILIPLANQEEVGEEVVQVYPNPSKGEFKIILPKSLKSADIQLFDASGRERTLMYVGEQAQAEGLVQGAYFLRVQKGEKMVTSKLIIE